MTSRSTSTISTPALCLILGLLLAMGSMLPGAEARALFVFGDSLVDSGNNNYLATSARADMPPYGVDYPTQRPTGRFSNGYNIPDFLSQQLGSNEAPLPYLDPAFNGQKLLVGANFASAGIGILNDTGIQFKLYDLGARKVLVTGTGPLGCVPSELAQRGRNGQCAPDLQQAAALFNPQLVQMLNGLNSRLGNVFIAANTQQMHNDFINNPQAYGFVTSKVACCGQGPYNGIGLCTIVSNLCPNRDQYAFWDAFHPSEKANKIIVQQFMTGSSEYMTPMNISTMLSLDS